MITVREIQEKDISNVVGYWKNSTPEHLKAMGIDISELYALDNLEEYLKKQISANYSEKSALFMIGVIDNKAVGHCYVNGIKFKEEASMHLHIWDSNSRQKGLGIQLVQKSIPFFFDKLELKNLLCEPYFLNIAPNKTLEKIGFEFEKRYITIPAGWNFKLEVNQWKLTRNKFKKLFL